MMTSQHVDGHPVMTTRYVVAVSGTESSWHTLQWIAGRVPESAEILVVHATSAPIVVRNGPSPGVAAQLDGAPWTQVATHVATTLLRHRHETVVDHGTMLDVLARYVEAGDVVVIGHVARNRRRLRLSGRIHKRTGAAVLSVDLDGGFWLFADRPEHDEVDEHDEVAVGTDRRPADPGPVEPRRVAASRRVAVQHGDEAAPGTSSDSEPATA